MASTSANSPTATTRKGKQAKQNYNQLITWEINGDPIENKFPISKCPCCGAQMGQVEIKEKKKRKIIGIKKNDNGSIVFYCPEKKFHFHKADHLVKWSAFPKMT